MRCDYCPLCPTYDEVCDITDSEYGTVSKDGELGCKHPRNWIEKRHNEYCEDAERMGTDMGIEMTLGEDGVKEAIKLCKHMIGLDHKKPYRRHGKMFYRPYRNYFSVRPESDNILGKLPKYIMNTRMGEKYVSYSLTKKGLDWLGRQLHIKIWEESD